MIMRNMASKRTSSPEIKNQSIFFIVCDNYFYDLSDYALTWMSCYNVGKESSVHLCDFQHALLHVMYY